MNDFSMDDFDQEEKRSTGRLAAMLIGGFIYFAAIVYCEIHNISLLLKGVAKGSEPVAIFGVVCLGLTALAMPLVIHLWVHGFGQKIAAFIFYALDFLLVIMNVIVDYNNNADSQALPDWVKTYVAWVVPTGPVLCGICFAVLFMLDPDLKLKAELSRLKGQVKYQSNKGKFNTMLHYLNARKNVAAQNAEYRAMVEGAAERDQLSESQRLLKAGNPTQPMLLPAQTQQVRQQPPLQISQPVAPQQPPTPVVQQSAPMPMQTVYQAPTPLHARPTTKIYQYQPPSADGGSPN